MLGVKPARFLRRGLCCPPRFGTIVGCCSAVRGGLVFGRQRFGVGRQERRIKSRVSTPSASPSLTRMAWIVVAVLMPVALLNYLDRQMLASMKESVMRDIPTIGSDGNWGYMLGQFKWVYAVCSLFGGYLADRFSRRLTICTSLFVWSVITW